MRKFDYSFLRNISLDNKILSATNYIHGIRADEENKKRQHKKIFEKMVALAIVRSVKASNAIEGIVTTDKRIAAIVNQNSSPLNHSEKEIAGYRDALKLVHENYDKVGFTEQDILGLHSILLSLAETSFRGKYKEQDNVIISIDQHGTRSIRFRPLSARETKQGMEQLVLAYADAKQDTSINQLLLIPCVILDFLCIHPFMDGNGRMSRLLSLLLLYQNGYDAGKYISFEGAINDHKDEYYETLYQSSLGWTNNENDYLPFIRNFIDTLYICYQELDKRFDTLNNGIVTKEKRIEDVLLNSLLPMAKKEISDLLPDISFSTIERVLAVMLSEGRIVKYGTFKNARYQRK